MSLYELTDDQAELIREMVTGTASRQMRDDGEPALFAALSAPGTHFVTVDDPTVGEIRLVGPMSADEARACEVRLSAAAPCLIPTDVVEPETEAMIVTSWHS